MRLPFQLIYSFVTTDYVGTFWKLSSLHRLTSSLSVNWSMEKCAEICRISPSVFPTVKQFSTAKNVEYIEA